MEGFSERLKELRQSKGLSQNALAKELGVSSRNYQRYEYGEIDAPVSALVAARKFFNVSADYLLGLSDSPQTAAAM
ncbi:MAG: helix-turn-helix transcriptional regulator [Selenomonadaceae bacterium]|nr:helix-turn-helix transcriptional regulator [Selenomonadaceae bacterium]MBR6887745.1 helix-turn-helix transcriptional regulator [Selenomonadaceae bacterium]